MAYIFVLSGGKSVNLLLIVRAEIVCLIILIYLLLNGRIYQNGEEKKSFSRLSLFALCHVVFDIITVITVNHLETTPYFINWIAHVIFYLSAILFSYEFFIYTAEICVKKEKMPSFRLYTALPIAVYILLLFFLPIEFIQANGTNSSTGPAAVVGYGVAFLFFVGQIVILIRYWNQFTTHLKQTLIPMLAVLMVAETIQIAVPELLFTGCAVTVVTIGFFFSLENPSEVFLRKAQIDAMTGVKSRHCYDMDIVELEKRYSKDNVGEYAVVFCDLNNLRNVNNFHGHAEGDNYIATVAHLLINEMKSAEQIYRMGGDEFMVMYHNVPEETVQSEINRVQESCEEKNREFAYRMTVAMGYAMSGPEHSTMRGVLKAADYKMYANKAELKRRNAFRGESGTDPLNVTGLTDRIFDLFASSYKSSMFYICNLNTNVSRISAGMLRYFGVRDEYMFDLYSLWLEKIHPDDRQIFSEMFGDMFSSDHETHTLKYRVMNAEGQYVQVKTQGIIIRGKNEDEDTIYAEVLSLLKDGE